MVNQLTMSRSEEEHEEGGNEIERVQAVPVRRHADKTGRWVAQVTITEAVEKAGLEAGNSLRYIPGEVENLGLVPALGFPSGDGRTDDLARKITRAGNERGAAYRVVIPPEVLETLAIEDEEIGGDDPVKLTVYAGDGTIAFEPFDGRTLPAFDVEETTGV